MLHESSDQEHVGTVGNDESSTNKNEKGSNREANLFLMNKHPELFNILPRPGGYLKHLAAQKKSSRTVVDKSGNKPSTSASSTTNGSSAASPANISEILETTIRCPSASRPVSKEDQRNNTVRMCSIAISTVMMLAQNIYEDITLEHVKHTEEYFRGLKQADGYPHNVGQLLQLLTNLKMSARIATSSVDENEHVDQEIEEDPTNTIEMTDLINGN